MGDAQENAAITDITTLIIFIYSSVGDKHDDVTWEELFGWSADLSCFSYSVSDVGFGSSPDCAEACCFPYSFRRALEVQNLQYVYWIGCGDKTKKLITLVNDTWAEVRGNAFVQNF